MVSASRKPLTIHTNKRNGYSEPDEVAGQLLPSRAYTVSVWAAPEDRRCVAHSRVVLIGDEKQLGAVDAGKPFVQLQKAGMKTAV